MNDDRPSGGPLGDIVVRAALIEATRLTAGGVAATEAAARVCRGAWRPYRYIVERRLRAAGGSPSATGDESGGPAGHDTPAGRLPPRPARGMLPSS